MIKLSLKGISSLREKTGRKSGGQIGHKGHTLEMKSDPDEVYGLKSDFCQIWGKNLVDLEQQLISKRQEIILPPIEPIYVEYRQWGYLCPYGHHQKVAYPNGINAPIQFGSSIVALVSYLNVFQYVPYARLKLLFKDIFNLSISEGINAFIQTS